MEWAIIGAIVTIFSAIIGAATTAAQIGANKQAQEQALEKQEEFNEQQREWELEDQEKLFAREDTAIQRRAADLKAAGINPLLAGGQGAAATLQPVRQTQSGASYIQSALNGIDFSQIQIGSLLDNIKTIEEIQNMSSDTEGKELDNLSKQILVEYQEKKIKGEIEESLARGENIRQITNNLEREYEYMFNEEQRRKLRADIEKELYEYEKGRREWNEFKDYAETGTEIASRIANIFAMFIGGKRGGIPDIPDTPKGEKTISREELEAELNRPTGNETADRINRSMQNNKKNSKEEKYTDWETGEEFSSYYEFYQHLKNKYRKYGK